MLAGSSTDCSVSALKGQPWAFLGPGQLCQVMLGVVSGGSVGEWAGGCRPGDLGLPEILPVFQYPFNKSSSYPN